MVLQDEAAGRTGHRRGGTRRNLDGAGQPARRIFQLDAEHPRLDFVAATLVGAPNPGVVLQGTQTHYGGARYAREVRHVRLDKPRAGSRRPRYLVQLGIVAVFDTGLARENGHNPEQPGIEDVGIRSEEHTPE